MVQGIFEIHYVFIFEQNIIVLYNNKNSFDYFNKGDEYNEFIEFIQNYTLSVGVSKLFDGISGITEYRTAVRIARGASPGGMTVGSVLAIHRNGSRIVHASFPSLMGLIDIGHRQHRSSLLVLAANRQIQRSQNRLIGGISGQTVRPLPQIQMVSI